MKNSNLHLNRRAFMIGGAALISTASRILNAAPNCLRQGGAQSLMSLERLQKSSNAGGFVADVVLAVDPEATPVAF